MTGKYHRGQPAPEGSRLSSGPRAAQVNDAALERVEALRAFAQSRNHTLLDLAFSWLLSHSVIASVIAGATKPEQVKANVAAADWRMSEDDCAAVDAILKD